MFVIPHDDHATPRNDRVCSASGLDAMATILAAPPAERITIAALARQQKVAPSTAWRWATKGLNQIRLPTVLIGSRRVTTQAVFRNWCEQRTTAANDRLVSDEACHQPSANVSRAERAEAELTRLGLEE
jgi:hypothetical protein